MTEPNWRPAVEALRGRQYRLGVIGAAPEMHTIAVGPGLADGEVACVERTFGFRFPPDLRGFLQAGLPTGPGFPDWRSDNLEVLRASLDAPLRGILFDIENEQRWPNHWGATRDNALDDAAAAIACAPRLIPVFAHRMLPAEPHASGNPVLSVHQSDIIVYGADLADYLRREFRGEGSAPIGAVRRIRFWSDLMDR